MFTGIITDVGEIAELEQRGDLRARIATSYDVNGIEIGASIACDGVCLTVIALGVTPTNWFDVEMSAETVNNTNIGRNGWFVGKQINLERALKVGDELGGHIVSGHIHCMAEILSINHLQDNCKMQLSLAKEWQKYVLYKGFVSVNGASLTVGEVDELGFWLHLIPETLAITNLDNYREGDKLNIEVDQQTYTIINTVENYLEQQAK